MIDFKGLPGLLITLILCQRVLAFTFDTCCLRAQNEEAFIPPWPNSTEQICGQVYSANTIAAANLFVNYTYCASSCGGIGLSQARSTGAWAAPLVQFILPSVIFSMTIPRRKKIEYDYIFDWKCNWWKGHEHFNNFIQLTRSLVVFVLLLIPVTVDTIVWISVILCGAGNMLIGGFGCAGLRRGWLFQLVGLELIREFQCLTWCAALKTCIQFIALYEAHLDYRVVKYVLNMETADCDANDVKLDQKRELLVTVACGNLQLDAKAGSPQKTIPQSIITPGEAPPKDGGEKGRSRLLNLLGAQSSFGGAVGSPVLFFLGAFVYTILDLLNNPSSEDAAISLGFGIEWMIIVHVAIMSGCLLAANNPSTSAGIVGAGHEALDEPLTAAPTLVAMQWSRPHSSDHPQGWTWERFSHTILGWSDSYDTKFQPVSLWSRGTNKMAWIRLSGAYKTDPKIRDIMEITPLGWYFKVGIPTIALIVLPPATGGVVAYFTPPQGLGCRSLSFIVYAFCQVIVTFLALISNAVDDGVEDRSKDSLPKYLFTGISFRLISTPFWFVSLIAAVGGTTMQIVGVYRNCICYSGATNWWNIHQINPAINIASDTQLQRNSSHYWIWMGITATLFMAVNCYIGWWYQRLIRHRFINAVKSMYYPSPRAPERTSISTKKAQTSPASDSIESTEIGLLLPESASLWSEDAQSAITGHALAVVDPYRQSSRAQHRSSEEKGSTTSSQLPLLLLTGAKNQEDFEMTARIPRPRSGT